MALLHVRLLLLGPAGHLEHVLLAVMAKAQEILLNHASVFQASAPVLFANLPLDKANQVDKPKVKGYGRTLCKEMESHVTRGRGYREW